MNALSDAAVRFSFLLQDLISQVNSQAVASKSVLKELDLPASLVAFARAFEWLCRNVLHLEDPKAIETTGNLNYLSLSERLPNSDGVVPKRKRTLAAVLAEESNGMAADSNGGQD